jgi:DNA-binding GntR family transcriptional regulator
MTPDEWMAMAQLLSFAPTKNVYAYQELKRRILTGQLEPGSVISQSALAQELGVSTTPLREALRQLAAEGLVEIESHRDARVASLTADDARNLFAIRQSLDSLAGTLAARHRTDEDITSISAHLEKLVPLGESDDLSALGVHRDFHRAIYRAAHNPQLFGILEGLWDKADQYRQFALRQRKRRDIDDARVAMEHAEIVAAIVSGDGQRAERAMREHVEGSLGHFVIEVLENN